jgi:hypothetical protein
MSLYVLFSIYYIILDHGEATNNNSTQSLLRKERTEIPCNYIILTFIRPMSITIIIIIIIRIVDSL